MQSSSDWPGARGQFAPAILVSAKPKWNNPNTKIQTVNRIMEHFIKLESNNFIDVNIADILNSL